MLSAVLGLCSLPYRGAVRAEALSVGAVCAVLMCADSGEVLFEKNADQRCAIASITKIMTAVIALEEAAANDREVVFDDSMTAEGSSMHLQKGEILRLSELVKGMMAVSGNDAANACAVAAAGSREAFAERMNVKARQLGMKNSHFVTPSGLDDEQHYSSARDMALLCAYAMENERFREIVSQKRVTVNYVLPEGKTQVCVNHNKLLSLYEGCIGIKTGFTKKAGRTLTSCAERSGVRLIAVTLNDSNDWEDHRALLDYGFSLYEQQELISGEERFELPVAGSEKESITVRAENACSPAVKKDGSDHLTYKLYMPPFCYAPIEKGRQVGELCVWRNGRKIWQTRLLADEAASYEE